MIKKKWLIPVLIIGVIMVLWFIGIIPKQVAKISGTSYVKNHFPEMQLECVGVEYADVYGNYLITFKGTNENTYSCVIGPKYFPVSMGQGLFAIESDYAEIYKNKLKKWTTNRLKNSNFQKDDDVVAEYVDTLLNSQYSKYFENLELFCCEYGTNDDGVFNAIVYSEEEKYSFSADYDIKNKKLYTTASREYHYEAVYADVKNTVEETMSFDNPVTEHYMLTINSEPSTEFIEDYDKFVTDKDTNIEIMMFFDKPISNTEADQIQTLMHKLKDKQFKGSLQYNIDDNFSKEFDFKKTYETEEIKKCDQI